jgi:hypothetical protein
MPDHAKGAHFRHHGEVAILNGRCEEHEPNSWGPGICDIEQSLPKNVRHRYVQNGNVGYKGPNCLETARAIGASSCNPEVTFCF